MNAPGPSREAQALLDRLRACGDLIEQHEAALYLLNQERLRLRAALAATGWRPPEPEPQGSLPL